MCLVKFLLTHLKRESINSYSFAHVLDIYKYIYISITLIYSFAISSTKNKLKKSRKKSAFSSNTEQIILKLKNWHTIRGARSRKVIVCLSLLLSLFIIWKWILVVEIFLVKYFRCIESARIWCWIPRLSILRRRCYVINCCDLTTILSSSTDVILFFLCRYFPSRSLDIFIPLWCLI